MDHGEEERCVDGDEKNAGMEEVVFSDGSADGGAGRGTIGGELLQFELSQRGSYSETGGFHQV